MSGIQPSNGVSAASTQGSVLDPILAAGCENTFYPGRCNPRLDPYAMNSLISEVLNAVNSLGITYDCNRLNNLALALATLNLTADQIVALICADQSASQDLAECVLDATSDNQIIIGPNGRLYVPEPEPTPGFNEWAVRVGIGQVYMVDTSLTGVDIPPSAVTAGNPVFVELTASQTYNAGKLGGQTLTGGGTQVVATATVILADSPLLGQTIHLLNTEGRIIRPSAAPGTVQTDNFQAHGHVAVAGSGCQEGQALSTVDQSGTREFIGSAENGRIVVVVGACVPDVNEPESLSGFENARWGNETRMKNIGVTAYMRIR